jgi:hypothetical protein
MHRTRQLLGEFSVDPLVTRNGAESLKHRADQDKAKVRFRVHRHAVLMTFVLKLHVHGLKGPPQALGKLLFYDHAVPPEDQIILAA